MRFNSAENIMSSNRYSHHPRATRILKVKRLDMVNIIVSCHSREKHTMYNTQLVLHTEITSFYLATVNPTWLFYSTDKSSQQECILAFLNVVLILSTANNNFEKLLFTLELLQIDSQKSLLIAIFF